MKKFTIITLLAIMTTFTSCTPEPVITFEDSSVIFYLTKSEAEQLTAAGINEVEVYISGEYEGFMSTNFYALTDPNCGDSDFLTITKSLSEDEVFPFEVRIGNVVAFSGSIELLKGVCIKQRF